MTRMQAAARPWLRAGIVAAAMGAAGCDDGPLVLYIDGGQGRFDLASSQDDGVVRVVRALLPGEATGYVFSDSPDLIVGNLSDGTNVMSSRALLRFDLSGWTSGNLSLRIKCTSRSGSPSGLQVYAVHDFGPLPPGDGSAGDVSGWWNLHDTGVLVGAANPSSGSWTDLTVQETTVRARLSGDGHLAFVLAYDTTKMPGEYYSFASFDYAAMDGQAPYLERYRYPYE